MSLSGDMEIRLGTTRSLCAWVDVAPFHSPHATTSFCLSLEATGPNFTVRTCKLVETYGAALIN